MVLVVLLSVVVEESSSIRLQVASFILDFHLFSGRNMIATPVWARTCQLSSSRVLLKHVWLGINPKYVRSKNMSDQRVFALI